MMKKMKMITFLVITCCFGMPLFVQAQDSTGMKTRAFQFGFITPVSTNGLNSWNVANKFSINLLAGYAGGVDGVEFSGLGSVLQKDMTGAQFSGLGGVVLGKTRGVQFSGLFNIGLDDVKAAQFAGLVNVSAGDVKGFQAAGLVNSNAGKFKGFQASGLVNANTDTTLGVQVAGLVNYASGIRLTQVSGLANVVTGENCGLQLAGLLNVSAGRLSGAQIAGLFNYAGHLKGVQIGVFNYVDSLEKGIPIGFLSFVRNGYTAFEVGATESLYGVVSFKTGVRQFYNILSVGGGYRDGLTLFAWGYGLGTFISFSPKTGLSIDGICYQVNEDGWFTNRLNLLNKINLNISWNIAKHLAVFGGLSWNVTVSDITDEYGDPVKPHIAPWSVFDETYDGHINIKMYPGISAGIRI
jgi:hypothetical protein